MRDEKSASFRRRAARELNLAARVRTERAAPRRAAPRRAPLNKPTDDDEEQHQIGGEELRYRISSGFARRRATDAGNDIIRAEMTYSMTVIAEYHGD